jgi:arylsulfatase A-like enzyme
MCDELRRDALSCYGDPNIVTPNLDRLAAEGVRFGNACSTYPICVPHRFTLMTGEYAHTRMIPGIEWRMSPCERTLADEFNDAGYETLYVGKWHLAGGHLHMPGYGARHEGVKPVPRLYRGRWQHWRGFELRNAPFDTYYFADDDPTPRRIDGYQTDGLCDIAMGFLAEDRDAGKPFCAVISVEPPHPPYEAPAELEEKWTATPIETPPNFLVGRDNPFADAMGEWTWNEERRADCIRRRQVYYAMVENLDWNVGRVLDFLEQQGLRDNTVIMFLSDHGELDGAHGLEAKQYPYEESTGIPLLVAGPGVPRGRVLTDPVCTEDLFPSLLGLAGLPAPPDLPGVDLGPLIRGERDVLDRPGVMLQFVSETRPGMPFHRCVWRSFRSARWRYDVAGDLTGMRPWQFFDLQEDPWELDNLVGDASCRELVARHHAWLRDRMAATLDDAALAPAFGCDGLNLEWRPGT